MTIHKTAIVSKKAKIGKNVEIGPWCVVEDGAVIGDGTKLWHSVYVASDVVIGEDNIVHMGAVLGHEPQHLAYAGGRHACPLRIGNKNIIREYATIHRSFTKDGRTVIGNNNFFMGFSHIAHDCELMNNIIMCQGAMLGGHVTVEDNVFIGGAAAAHQFSRIGELAMVGGLTRVNQDVVPYTLVECDARVRGLNIVGIRRSDLSEASKRQIKEIYRFIYLSGLNTTNAIKEIRKASSLTPEAKHMVDFIERSKRGICGHIKD